MAQRVASWRDGKRYLWLNSIVLPLLPVVSFGIWHESGQAGWWWLTPLFVFGLMPLLDATGGEDPTNPPAEALPSLERDRYYRWCTYLYLPVHFVGLVMACWAWQRGALSVVGLAGLVLSSGLVSGVGINTAHELGHKRDRLERWLSKIALAPTAYGHFYVEHNRGHHVRVSTPEDPASARFGESFWQFWPRTVAGSLVSAWSLESRRLRLRQRSPWTLRNEVLNAWLFTLVLFGALAAWFGPGVLVLLSAQAVIGFSLLEVVNYVEHYGLVRRRAVAGRYERVEPEHSWNSDRIASNLALYHLQRHSDHHANPTRRYQVLRSFAEAPQLPTGYASMILVALVPPIWRSVMDRRVLAHYDGDVSRTNLSPKLRAKIEAGTWSAPPADPAAAGTWSAPRADPAAAGSAVVAAAAPSQDRL